MSTNYFSTCQTVAEIKTLYHKLAMQYHPDRGGDLRTMQDINTQYADALRRSNGQVSVDKEGYEHEYAYDAEKEAKIVEFIDRLIKSGVLNDSNVEAYLIGTWVWVRGDTKPHKDTLGKNGLGCTWHSKRQCWYWNCDEKKSWYSKKGLSSLAAEYGAEKLDEDKASTGSSQRSKGKGYGKQLPSYA